MFWCLMHSGRHSPVSAESGPMSGANSLPRLITLYMAFALLAACATLGDSFDRENARRVRNGMTREEVIRIMGSPPTTVEGTDPSKLVWLYATSDPMTYSMNRITIRFDEYGKSCGIPKDGIIGSGDDDSY